jgi:hypothetical protein
MPLCELFTLIGLKMKINIDVKSREFYALAFFIIIICLLADEKISLAIQTMVLWLKK